MRSEASRLQAQPREPGSTGLPRAGPRTTPPFTVTLPFRTGFLVGVAAVGSGLPHPVRQDLAPHRQRARRGHCSAWRRFGSEAEPPPHGNPRLSLLQLISSPLSCLQLGVLRERRAADSLEQAGELRLPGGEHDRRGPDAGVVPPQGIASRTPAFLLARILLGTVSRRTDSKLFPLIPFCPRLQALRHGGRSGVEAQPDPMPPLPFPRAGGGRYAQSRGNQAQRTDGSISALLRTPVWQIPSFYILITSYLACIAAGSRNRLCLFLRVPQRDVPS